MYDGQLDTSEAGSFDHFHCQICKKDIRYLKYDDWKGLMEHLLYEHPDDIAERIYQEAGDQEEQMIKELEVLKEKIKLQVAE